MCDQYDSFVESVMLLDLFLLDNKLFLMFLLMRCEFGQYES